MAAVSGRGADPLDGDPDLREQYRRTVGPVAFVDESADDPRRGEPGFYTMTAVLFDRAKLRQARQTLRTAAAGPTWHTSEAYQLGRDQRILDVVGAVARTTEWNVVTLDVPLWHGSEKNEARRRCLEYLLEETTRGPRGQRVQMFVLDQNTDEYGNRSDQRIARAMRGRGRTPHDTLVVHSTDDAEIGLWAPDAVGWAVRRSISADEGRWAEPVSELVSLVDARDGHQIDWPRVSAAALNPAGPHARDLVLNDAESTRRALSNDPQLDPNPVPADYTRFSDLLQRVRAIDSADERATEATRDEAAGQEPVDRARDHRGGRER